MSEADNVTQFDPSRRRGPTELGYIPMGTVGAETIENLRHRRFIREQADSIDIDPVNPGETICGYLNEHEQPLYIEIATLATEAESLQREQMALSYENIAKAIRLTPHGQNVLKNLDENVMFIDEASAEEYFALITKLTYLRAILDQSIRERYGYSNVLGVRQGFSVVKVMSKYKLPREIIDQAG